ncbi:uncharacterized protein LOC116348814 [Contarinia nasturtii]|uniref:uncharacterized protein LOC116348814 n=1 Tax=Contarinia nasturtii TaxID=265458 RepID=UPI0012D3F9BE|nr:uncharacterized protein LOC116348814 [Contarinia nasturtii]
MNSSVICLVALTLCFVSASAAPQSTYQPLQPFQSFQPFQPFISFFQNFPRPPFLRPQVQVVPSVESVPVQPPPAQHPQQLVQTQSPQVVEVPTRQNGWFWQNWAPLPFWNIPQYSQDGPTIIIVSNKPPKIPASENSNLNQTVSQTTTTTTENTVSTTISTSAPTTEAPTQATSTENATNMPELGLTVVNQPVPLAPMESLKPNVKAQ